MKNAAKGRFSGATGGSEYDLFKLSAPHYDEMEAKVGEILKDHFARRTVGWLDVLDIGTGTGDTAEVVLNADTRILITSIDSEPTMCKVAEGRFYGEERIRIFCKDALEYLTWEPQESVDAVVSAFTIHNCEPEYRKELFVRISTVLRPGGIFINCDKHAVSDEAVYAANLQKHLDSLKVFDTIGRPDVRDAWEKHYLEDEKIKMTDKEVGSALMDNGFESVRYSDKHWLDVICVAVKPIDGTPRVLRLRSPRTKKVVEE